MPGGDCSRRHDARSVAAPARWRAVLSPAPPASRNSGGTHAALQRGGFRSQVSRSLVEWTPSSELHRRGTGQRIEPLLRLDVAMHLCEQPAVGRSGVGMHGWLYAQRFGVGIGVGMHGYWHAEVFVARCVGWSEVGIQRCWYAQVLVASCVGRSEVGIKRCRCCYSELLEMEHISFPCEAV